MKNKRYICGCLAGVLALASCSRTKEMLPAGGMEVSFAASCAETKAVTDFGTGITRFTEGDAVSLWSEGLAPDMEGAAFTVGADGLLVYGGKDGAVYRYCGDEGASFTACSPAAKSSSDLVSTFTAATDQSSAGGFSASDFMTAEASVAAAQTAPVDLKFTHRMALIKVTPKDFSTRYESVMTGVTANGVYTTLEWNRAENIVSAVTDGETASVIFLNTGDSFVAAVPPQEIAAGAKFLTITTDDGRTFTYTPAESITLKAGEILHLKF